MPNSTLHIDAARRNRDGSRAEVELKLERGEVENRVQNGDGRKRDWSLNSSSLQIGVRGTVFSVQKG